MEPNSKPSQRALVENPNRMEWPTLLLWFGVTLVWFLSLYLAYDLSPFLAGIICTFAMVLHSSLSHEVLHGHPFRSSWASQALVVVSPGLFIPYFRFRDTHLAHHQDARLTDPYDDPESNYLDPAVWSNLPGWQRFVLRSNNLLLGRMVIGPLIALISFMKADFKAIRAKDVKVMRAWLWHVPGVVLVLWIVGYSAMPVWVYLVCAYCALSILKIRTFLEHQAHEKIGGRTVIIEDRGLLAFLFLNNNLHVVHHMHPQVPWFRLPRLYRSNPDRFQSRNGGYVYRSYGQIFRAHLFRAKDTVPHPLWPSQ